MLEYLISKFKQDGGYLLEVRVLNGDWQADEIAMELSEDEKFHHVTVHRLYGRPLYEYRRGTAWERPWNQGHVSDDHVDGPFPDCPRCGMSWQERKWLDSKDRDDRLPLE